MYMSMNYMGINNTCINFTLELNFNILGFFIPGFPKLIRFQDHHDKVMNKLLPKLKKHLDKNGVETGLYTLKWFFQCFLDRVSSLVH